MTTTRTQHTPGPWQAEPAPLGTGHSLVLNEAGQLVASCEMRYEQGRADARLIAAAPDLLAELERVMEHARNQRGRACLLCGWAVGHAHDAPCSNVLEVIAKARGKGAS